MAGFASHVYLRPGGVEAIGCGIVVLFEICRVAVGALVVPVLIDASPVKRMSGRQLLVGVEMEPALATLVLRPRIPGNAQRLHPAIGK